MTTWTIYCHTHTNSGRKYVGLTKQKTDRRWKHHVYSALHGKPGKYKTRSYFASAIRKYGAEAFTHEILEVCNTLEQANAAEIAWIVKLDTRNREKGFNLTPGGSHTPHPNNPPWGRPDYRAKQIAYKTGQVFTPERLLHMSKSHMGKVATEDSKTKVSISLQSAWAEGRCREKKTSKHVGVDYQSGRRGTKRWRARKSNKMIGRFATEAEAVEALKGS